MIEATTIQKESYKDMEDPALQGQGYEEEDEELLEIFFDFIRESLLELLKLIPPDSRRLVSDDLVDTAQMTIDSIVRATYYMDYSQVLRLLEEWEKSIGEEHKKGTLDRERFLELFNVYCRQLNQILPPLQLPFVPLA